MAMNLGSWASRSVATLVVATDGTGDFTDIQDAVNALPATGGCVYIKEGTYTLTASIVIPSDNISIIGCGRSTHIIETAAVPIISVGGRSYFSIENVFLDGSAGTSLAGVYFTSSHDNRVTRCWIEDCGANGVAVITSGYRILVANNLITRCHHFGISTYDVYEEIINSNLITDCGEDLDGSGGIAVTLSSHCVVSNNVITDCFRSTITNGISIIAADFCTITGNVCVNNSGNGIYVGRSTRNTITGNVCQNNSIGNVNTFSGIKLAVHTAVNSIYNVVNDNQCIDTSLIGTQKYGIEENDANQDHNVIVGNVCKGNVTAEILRQGANTEIAHNQTT